ncbi:hypothetical protein CLV24_12349 [Pontibacter ummariensis]|uniref:Outer membrane protein beta-barrel domain-containing protein n=1 Tax=Pontibacter ummariensis TaxID=1610492 RepID=A0A239JRT9_9BACT|nr:hypothetical protein [Pontibacter ummariensis]PRY07400.1 hypothetical protein CLV24_12349 [Pontibacter ummariensis]SNT08550.1 hypothetical protein SAMN06296052_12349 [Pontibacter ummariensis]
MKIRLLVSVLCLLSFPFQGIAQDKERDSRNWYAPDGVTLQFAGNTGMFSAGPSYSFLQDKLSAELLYGFVPKLDGKEVLHLLTVRGVYRPIRRVDLSRQVQWTPLRMNLGLSYYFRDQFSTSWDSSYPKNYYWWTSSLRITGGIGTELTRQLNGGTLKEVSLYGELSTYDLIVTSAVKDPTLTAWDILSFAVGVRAGF